MNNSRTSRLAIAGLVIAAAGGAIAATVLTLATVSFFTPDAWPGSSTGTAGETSAGKIVEPAAAASHALAQVQSASNGTLGSTPEALDGWDRYLFEAGRRNRVSIASIIPGSAAETAGLQVGDQVLAYADTRVFVPNDLQQATQSGARGEAVALTVRRAGGFNQTLNVVRGPLGVTLARERSEP